MSDSPYQAACEAACVHCAANREMADLTEGVKKHWFRAGPFGIYLVDCTAPTHDEFDRQQAARIEQLREAAVWAYQLAGAVSAPVEALDNLSALAQGQQAPHEWGPARPISLCPSCGNADSELFDLKLGLWFCGFECYAKWARFNGLYAEFNQQAERIADRAEAATAKAEVHP